MAGKIVLAKNVTFEDLQALIITDYTNNGQKSLDDLKSTRLPHLGEVFGGSKAHVSSRPASGALASVGEA